jgi:hypothetical protein
VAPAGERLAVSARELIPEGVRDRLRAQKEPLLRLLREAEQIAAAQTEAVIGRRVQAGMELLWEMEVMGRDGEPEYALHLAMFVVVLFALELRRHTRPCWACP